MRQLKLCLASVVVAVAQLLGGCAGGDNVLLAALELAAIATLPDHSMDWELRDLELQFERQQPAVPMASAISAWSQTGHDYTLSTASDTDTYTVQMSFRPGAQTTFEGHLVATVMESAVVIKNGTTAETITGTSYFEVNPYKPWGYIGSDGSYTVMSDQERLPSSATVGQHGPLYNATSYTSNTKQSLSSTSVASWSIESDTDATAWGCVTRTITASGDEGYTVSRCYKMDSAGNISALKATFVLDGESLTFWP